jgi:hypothetical protein
MATPSPIAHRWLLLPLIVSGSIGLAVWGTWPLAAHLSTHAYDPQIVGGWTLKPDVYLTLWVLAWDVHVLATNPAALFDANIFYPAPLSLAAMDHMLGALPLYAPLAAISRNPLFAHQATLLLTFAVAILAGGALVWDWTRSWPAALLGGVLFAFSPFRMGSLSSLNLLNNYYLPLIPLCARRVDIDTGKRWRILLGAVLALQALNSIQVGYAAFAGLGVLLVTVVAADSRVRRHCLRFAAPIAGAALVVGLLAFPYLVIGQSGGIHKHTLEVLRIASTQPGNTGAASIAITLAALGLLLWRFGVQATRVAGGWIAGLLATALVLHVLAMGPVIVLFGHAVPGPWALLSRVVPGFSAIRVPLRFNAVAIAAIAALAGIAVAGMQNWARQHPWTACLRLHDLIGLAAVAVAAYLIQTSLPGPFTLRQIETRETLPPAYQWLRTAAPGAVVEIPFRDFETFPFEREREALRQYRSVYHWHPIANGYSGYPPLTYGLVAAMAARLPQPDAVHDLAEYAGIRYAVVDDGTAPQLRAAWQQSGIANHHFEGATIYTLPLRRSSGQPPLARMATEPTRETPSGVPLTPLTAEQLRGALRDLVFSGVVLANFTNEASVEVENLSAVPWPGIAPAGYGGLMLSYRVLDANGQAVHAEDIKTPMAVDIPPGQRARVPLRFWAPPKPGSYRLEVTLTQTLTPTAPPVPAPVLTVPLSVAPFPWKG